MLLVTAQESLGILKPSAGGFRLTSAGWRWRCHQWFIAGQTLQGATLQQALEERYASVYEIGDRHQNHGIRTAGRGGL